MRAVPTAKIRPTYTHKPPRHFSTLHSAPFMTSLRQHSWGGIMKNQSIWKVVYLFVFTVMASNAAWADSRVCDTNGRPRFSEITSVCWENLGEEERVILVKGEQEDVYRVLYHKWHEVLELDQVYVRPLPEQATWNPILAHAFFRIPHSDGSVTFYGFDTMRNSFEAHFAASN